MRTAIILAGGRSSRFGSDKLVAELDGRSLLGRTIDAVSAVVDTVIVAGPELPETLRAAGPPVALVSDTEPFAGPLAALATALDHSADEPDDLAIVVGGDMPRVVPAVLQSMLDALDGDAAIEAVLLGAQAGFIDDTGGSARRQVLPLAVRVSAARAASRDAVDAGQRSLQALLDRLRSSELPAATWRPLDPSGRTLLDVDTPSDLERIRGDGT